MQRLFIFISKALVNFDPRIIGGLSWCVHISFRRSRIYWCKNQIDKKIFMKSSVCTSPIQLDLIEFVKKAEMKLVWDIIWCTHRISVHNLAADLCQSKDSARNIPSVEGGTKHTMPCSARVGMSASQKNIPYQRSNAVGGR